MLPETLRFMRSGASRPFAGVSPRLLLVALAGAAARWQSAAAAMPGDDELSEPHAAQPEAPAGPVEPAVKSAPTRAASTRGQSLDRIVAVVNDGTVMESQLEAETVQIAARLKAQNITPPPDRVLREQVLERLLLEEIQAQRATSAGMRVSDEQINATLEDMARQNKISFDKLPEALASQGIDYAAYRESVRREIQREYLRMRDVAQRINISPRELEEYMARQKRSVSADSEYNLSDILIEVSDNATAEQLAAARSKAQDLLQRARAGEAFDQLAVANSNGQTALEGGSLGWRTGGNLPTFAADVIGRMKPGEISEALQTGTGFHILRLNDVRGGTTKQIVEQLHLRHILLKTNELQDDATVEQRLTAMRERVLVGEDFAVLAKTSSEDSGSAIDGGDLGWQTPGTFVPEFTAVAEKLKDNEISAPFKTRYGWHVLQMLGRRSFDNTDTAARERAISQLRESRLDEATEQWLQQLRDEAYVEMRL